MNTLSSIAETARLATATAEKGPGLITGSITHGSIEGTCRERSSRLDRLLDARACEKLAAVGPQVACVLKKLREAGAQVEMVGSLARGDFKIQSDVDFLISDKGPLSELDVFNITSDHLKDAPFDLVFADKLKPENLELMRSDAHRR